MQVIELTLDAPEANLALDEALLLHAERAAEKVEFLRLWEAPSPFVVLGRSSKAADEVDENECQSLGVPVLRRTSGGGTIVAGPGCLMYAVVLSLEARPGLTTLDAMHREVLSTIGGALAADVPGVARRGTSDLAIGERKFSGNSLRVRRRHILYHGTLLYDFDLSLVERLLEPPPRQPEYRRGRVHGEFIANLPLTSDELRAALRRAWSAERYEGAVPLDLVEQLVREKYARREWNLSQ